ncbi:MAG: hypothetical protein ABSD73_04785 [Candidatus Bathyarchaeia archaeon]
MNLNHYGIVLSNASNYNVIANSFVNSSDWSGIRLNWQGSNGSSYKNVFSGSLVIVTLTFQPLRAGSTSLAFSYITIANLSAAPITNLACNGFVEVQGFA